MNYNVVYANYNKYYCWANNDLFSQMQRKWKLEAYFEPKLRRECLKIYFETFPRRHKEPTTKDFLFKYDDILEQARDNMKTLVEPYIEQCVKIAHKMQRLLADAELPEPTITMQVVNSCSESIYSSQGMGSGKYAKESLLLDDILLTANGYTTEYAFVNDDRHYKEHQLLANCETWVLESIRLSDDMDEELFFKVCHEMWKRGVNPKVYYHSTDEDLMEFTMYNREKTFENAWQMWNERKNDVA
jgi:hypothetical protein